MRIFRSAFLLFFSVILISVCLRPLPGRCEDTTPAETSADAASERFDFADGLYQRAMYDMAAEEYQKLLQDFPDHARTREAQFRLAESFFFLKDYDKAMDLYSRFAEMHSAVPQAETAKLRIAECLEAKNEKDEALARFESLAENRSAFVSNAAHYFAGRLLIEKGRLDDAEKHLSRLETPSEENAFAAIVGYPLGQIALERKDYKKAAVYFEMLRKAGKEDLTQLSDFGLGQIYFHSGKFQQARDYFLAASKASANPDIQRDASLNYLNALYESGDYQSVFDLASQEPMIQSQNSFKLKWLSANALLRLKKYPEAIQVFNEILALPDLQEEDRERAAFGKIEALLSQGSPEKAMAMADALKKDSKAKDRWEYLKAEMFKRAGKPDMAIQTLDQLIANYPDSQYRPQAYLNKAYTLAEAEQGEEADRAFEEFVTLFPDHALARQCAIDRISLNIKMQKYDAAVSLSKNFLEKYPESLEAPEIQYQTASLYLRLKHYDEAFGAYSLYQRNYPEGAKINVVSFFMGLTKQLAGEPAEALKIYEDLLAREIPDDLRQNTLKNKAISLVRLEKMDEAAQVYLEIIEKFPANNLEPQIHFYLADFFRKQNQPDKIDHVMANLLSKPEGTKLQARIEYFFGEAARMRKEYEKALGHYNKALEFDKNDALVYFAKGLMASEQKNLDEAALFFQEAVRFAANDTETALMARMEIARNFEARNDFLEAAKSYFAIAILFQSDPRISDALYQAGVNFEKAGKKEESRKAFQELIERFKDDPKAKEAAGRLQTAAKDR